ncbi:MAG: hypothetical protein JJ954_09925 [Hyphomonas sp.]|uniref:hypothetical protein n=1 Tax=unclassified Hyphomonas TaxID=2630699 RepID=UPI000E881D91|nr:MULTISPECIES: hypothetical protein [unclassified Hyphomonas]MBO6583260.1 hypothetical protein [Hyphomonas sp.]QSR21505.1 hypothetical protein CFA77_04300 [Hyphomonas sp. KY3]HAO36591.1 hypothetical protein [Hyphomonas sp.]HBX96787.1 hypothetical protein [Hyphomonas sp.]
MDKSSGWMQAVVFNSLLILMPVIAAQSLAMAFSGESFSESPTIESIDQTRRNIDETFASIAPRNGGDKYKFWHDIVERELMDMDVAAARGFLLAAPQMLDRESVRELEADSSGVKLDRPDDRMAAAALRKLPLDIGLKFEKAQASAGPRNTPSSTSIVEEEEASDDPADTQDADVPNEEPEVTVWGNTRPSDRRFVLLGSFSDLANNSERWLKGDRVDPITLKITALALIGEEGSDGVSDGNVRAASILKSARRARRMTPEFTAYMKSRLNDALPDTVLRPALEESLGELATTSVRVDRVRSAYLNSIDAGGLQQLEKDLAQIDRIGMLTSTPAAITLIEHVKDSSDLRRARLLAEAGGDRSVALVKQDGPGALRIADTGIKWTQQLMLQVMGLTASGLALLYVMIATFRRNVRLPKKSVEPSGI